MSSPYSPYASPPLYCTYNNCSFAGYGLIPAATARASASVSVPNAETGKRPHALLLREYPTPNANWANSAPPTAVAAEETAASAGGKDN